MTKEEAIEALKLCQSDTDPVAAHAAADEVLCRLLAALGHEDVVREWRAVRKP